MARTYTRQFRAFYYYERAGCAQIPRGPLLRFAGIGVKNVICGARQLSKHRYTGIGGYRYARIVIRTRSACRYIRSCGDVPYRPLQVVLFDGLQRCARAAAFANDRVARIFPALGEPLFYARASFFIDGMYVYAAGAAGGAERAGR